MFTTCGHIFVDKIANVCEYFEFAAKVRVAAVLRPGDELHAAMGDRADRALPLAAHPRGHEARDEVAPWVFIWPSGKGG